MEESLSFSFWAAEIKNDGVTSVKVGNADDALHLTMACYGDSVQQGSRSVLYCECNERKAPIAVLLQGQTENQTLDLIISGNTMCKFSVSGQNPSPVFLSGYVQPLVDAEDLGNVMNEETAEVSLGDRQEQVEPESIASVGVKRQLDEDDSRPKKKMKEVEEEVQSNSNQNDVEVTNTEEIREDVPEVSSKQTPEKTDEPKSPSQASGMTSPPDSVKSQDTPQSPSQQTSKKKKKKKKFEYRPSGLGVRVVKVGTGAPAKHGDTVRVKYIGQLAAGKTIFDKNLGEGFLFQLGLGEVVPGFEEGIMGMRVGGKRKLTIPSKIAYGSEGNEKIPPNSDLMFTIECAEVIRK